MTVGATIDPMGLHERLESAVPPRVLDVRTPGEFVTAHITGAHNVPLDLLLQNCDEIIAHLDDAVVLVCRSGQRARQAEEALRTAGPFNMRVLDGGMTACAAAGFAINRGRPRWDLERRGRLVAGAIVLSIVLGSTADPRFKWVAAAVGGGLAAASLTNTCAMGMALSKLPYNRGASCDAASMVVQLVGSSADRTAGRPA